MASIKMIAEDEATGKTKEIYDDIKWMKSPGMGEGRNLNAVGIRLS
jgi:hypothetical protein